MINRIFIIFAIYIVLGNQQVFCSNVFFTSYEQLPPSILEAQLQTYRLPLGVVIKNPDEAPLKLKDTDLENRIFNYVNKELENKYQSLVALNIYMVINGKAKEFDTEYEIKKDQKLKLIIDTVCMSGRLKAPKKSKIRNEEIQISHLKRLPEIVNRYNDKHKPESNRMNWANEILNNNENKEFKEFAEQKKITLNDLPTIKEAEFLMSQSD